MTPTPTPERQPPDRDIRSPRAPLAPPHAPGPAGAATDTDPQQDVAPNLGGEEQMQDA